MKKRRLSDFWKFYWVVFVVTLAIYGTMVLWTLPKISAFADGLAPFDLLPFGYSHQYALSLLGALNASGTEAISYYAKVQHGLDTIFPALSAFLLLTAIWRQSKGFRTSVRLSLTALPVVGSVFDYLENAQVNDMLIRLPQMPSESEVYWASICTLLKSSFVTLSFCGLIALIGLGLFQKFAAKRTR